MERCLLCGEEAKKLGQHIHFKHKEISPEQYYKKYIDSTEVLCIVCNKPTEFDSIDKGYKVAHKECRSSPIYKKWAARCCSKAGMIEKYGEIEGLRRWETRQEKCKPGKEAMIKRYGEEIGLLKWKESQNKRKISNSKEGLISKYGEKAEEIFKAFGKDRRKDELIQQFGEKEGKKQFSKLVRKSTKRCVEYWVERGYSSEEAKEKVAENQRTFTLERCIEKHGEIKGRQVWEDRQLKWQTTLNNKSPEEKEEILRKRVLGACKVGSISKPEKELKKILNCDSQVIVNGHIYDLGLGKNLIEFNGTYWHYDPRKFTADYYDVRRKEYARDSWERDRIKQENAHANGYRFMTIWEIDWKKNKNQIVEEARNFLFNTEI